MGYRHEESLANLEGLGHIWCWQNIFCWFYTVGNC